MSLNLPALTGANTILQVVYDVNQIKVLAANTTAAVFSTSISIGSDLTITSTQIEQTTASGLQLNSSHGSGGIYFSVAGAERARIDSSGRFGVGAVPSYLAHFAGVASGTTPVAYINRTNSAGGGAGIGLLIDMDEDSGGKFISFKDYDNTEQFYVTQGSVAGGTVYVRNKLGIGVTPGNVFHVYKNSPAATPFGIFQNPNDTGGMGIQVSAQTSVPHIGKLTAAAAGNVIQVGAQTNHPVTFIVNDTERMRIDTSGNVSVTTAAASLYVGGTGTGLRLLDNGTNSQIIPAWGRGTGSFQLYDAAGALAINITTTYTAIQAGGSERARIDSSGKLLVGTAFTINDGDAIAGGLFLARGDSDASIRLHEYSNDGQGPGVRFSKTRGTAAGTNTVVANGDLLGKIGFSAADGTSYLMAADIFAIVNGTPGTNDMPTDLVFRTTANGAGSPTERVRIDSSGNVGVGSSSIPANVRLQVVGTNRPLATSDTANLLVGSSDSAADDLGGSIGFQHSGVAGAMIAAIKAGRQTGTTNGGYLSFATRTDAAFSTERMRIDSSGTVLLNDNTLQRPILKDYAEVSTSPASASNVLTLNIENGNSFQTTLTENVTTVTISNPTASGSMCTITVRIVQGAGPYTITWPASFKWPGGTAGTLSTGSGDVDILTAITWDGGTTWNAVLVNDFS